MVSGMGEAGAELLGRRGGLHLLHDSAAFIGQFYDKLCHAFDPLFSLIGQGRWFAFDPCFKGNSVSVHPTNEDLFAGTPVQNRRGIAWERSLFPITCKPSMDIPGSYLPGGNILFLPGRQDCLWDPGSVAKTADRGMGNR